MLEITGTPARAETPTIKRTPTTVGETGIKEISTTAGPQQQHECLKKKGHKP
jgi:hypothetical protein